MKKANENEIDGTFSALMLMVFVLSTGCNYVIGLKKEALPEKGRCEINEDCDDGHGCTEEVCEIPGGICKYHLQPQGTVCRPSAGDCDIEETCDGRRIDCPPDSLLPETTLCREAKGQCDEPEYCTGLSPVCPENQFSPPDKTCDDGNPCTHDDKCDGEGNCTGINGIYNVVQISIGPWGLFTCARIEATIKCWGNNVYGQLGDGTDENKLLPTYPAGLTEVAISTVSAGGRHTCAIDETTRALCWGLGQYGELGDGGSGVGHQELTPVEVAQIPTGWEKLSAGTYHTCGINQDGKLYCWGSNSYGAIGNGTTSESEVYPVEVTGVENPVSVSAGPYHTCAIEEGKILKCWGKNDKGQLGNPSAGELATEPVEVAVISTKTVMVSTGMYHTCALSDDGKVYCWGYSEKGALGLEETLTSPTPAEVTSLPTKCKWVSTGFEHTCAITEEGELWCWGNNDEGQIGTGTKGGTEPLPVKVNGLHQPAVTVETGAFHTCALVEDSTVKCWGHNTFGELGDGTTESKFEPNEVHCE